MGSLGDPPERDLGNGDGLPPELHAMVGVPTFADPDCRLCRSGVLGPGRRSLASVHGEAEDWAAGVLNTGRRAKWAGSPGTPTIAYSASSPQAGQRRQRHCGSDTLIFDATTRRPCND